MKKKLRQSTLVAIMVIVISLQLVITAFATSTIPTATSDFYVNDFAGIFTEEEKASLVDKAVTLAEGEEGIQVVISTIESLDGLSIEEYANEMYNQYQIGKDDMGVLILLATSDRQMRIEIGDQMEAYITDSKAGRLMDDYAIPYLIENRFSEGLISLQNHMITSITEEIATQTTVQPPAEEVEKEPIVIDWGVVIFIVLAAIIAILFGILWVNAHKTEHDLVETRAKNLKLLEELKTAKSLKDEEVSRIRSSADEQITSLMKSLREEKEENENLSKQIQHLQDRKQRANRLVPDLEKKIDDAIAEEIRQRDMAAASQVDANIKEVKNLPASVENWNKFFYVITLWNDLTETQREYMNEDIGTIRGLCDQSKDLLNRKSASDALAVVIGLIGGITIAKEMHICNLEKAYQIYDRLKPDVKRYFDQNELDKLSRLLDSAKKDRKKRIQQEEEEARRREEERRRRRQQEEERRRQAMYDDDSDSGSGFGGGFSGFGGHSSGGGASRGF